MKHTKRRAFFLALGISLFLFITAVGFVVVDYQGRRLSFGESQPPLWLRRLPGGRYTLEVDLLGVEASLDLRPGPGTGFPAGFPLPAPQLTMAGKRRPWRALWAVGGVLPLWLGERTFALPVPSWMVGVAGWSLVALGFLTVALAALWSSRPRERRPSFWPYRPQGLFRVAVKSRRRR
ncbi:MAG: hypothetical protein ACLU8J_05335 [Acutalibacter sp.]